MADDDHLNGVMIALIPTAEDAARLRVPGGEATRDLHLTLMFLGDDANDWTPDQRTDLLYCLRMCLDMHDLEPITSNIFGAAHWNGNSPKPSWVWNVGEIPSDDWRDLTLTGAKYVAQDVLGMMHAKPDVPEQHCPWVPHVCAAYSADLTLMRIMEKRLGPVTFDRIRVSFGSEDHDFPLTAPEEPGEPVTASADLRRQLKDYEAHVNFAEHDRQWTEAVNTTTNRLRTEMADWRQQIREQIATAPDDPSMLAALHVDTTAAVHVLTDHMRSLAEQAGRAVQREAEAQGVRVPDWSIPENASEESLTAALGGKELLKGIAQISADLMASNMVQSAKRFTMGLISRRARGDEIAGEVDRALQSGAERAVQAPVKAAMSTAQNLGRNTVLRAAPEAESYTASEVLDKNTCKPCIAEDGMVFTGLDAAISAYPVMGYAGCAGSAHGNPCRGFIVANWGSGSAATASAATMQPETRPEEAPVTTETEALKKGDPNPGTKKDKRLKENMYAEEGHFSGAVETLAWDGSASRFSDPEYQKAAAACDSGDGSAKQRCFLPHHEPSGALNADGVHAAAQRFSALKGHSPEAVARAKAHLRGHYRTLGDPVPDVLQASALERAAFGVEEGYDELVFVKETVVHDSAQGTVINYDEDTETASGDTAPWRGPLTVEGIETGDGREFDSGALTWADLPLPLRWNRVDSHGGEARTEAVNVGRIDKIWREDSGLIMGEGVLDLADEDGRKVYGKIKGQHLRGVSVDVDSIKDADMELVWPEAPEGGDEVDEFAKLFASPEKVVFHKGRIRAATLVDIPAFAEAYIALLDEAGAIVAGGTPIGSLREARPVRHRTLTVDAPARPTRDWFTNPDLSVPTGITVTPDGRVYGHAALWGTCHIGQAGLCVTPPQEDQHPYFMTGSVYTEEGEMVSVGQITLGTGHADISANHRVAVEHYDNTGVAVADVAVGNDGHGIWVAGAVRPGTDPERIHELRASGQVSGDWRNIGGKLRLVGLLAVNVPGFPVPKLRAKYTGGHQLALVAAGLPQLTEGMTEEDLDQWAYARIIGRLGQSVHQEG